MSKATRDGSHSPAPDGNPGPPSEGMSPYATGGGGVTFERKVAVHYLAHLLVGNGAPEFGEGRRLESVAFQQAPSEPVDDLVLSAALPDEPAPSLVLALAVRRSPNLVQSNRDAQALVRQFVQAVTTYSERPEHRLGLAVAGPGKHATQLAQLAALAVGQRDAEGFFKLVRTPRKFDAAMRGRLDHVEALVANALRDLEVVEPAPELVRQRTWQCLSRLKVFMPRLEAPDESDWTRVADMLTAVAPNGDLDAAVTLRDGLVAFASDYAPIAARVGLSMLRRDAHALLNPAIRRHRQAWGTLDTIHKRARESVRADITAPDGRSVTLNRKTAATELRNTLSGAEAVVVSGQSGVGKSALAVLELAAAADNEPDRVQTLCVNLRQVPELGLSLETALGQDLLMLLSELSAPERMLVVDAAEAIAEGREDVFGSMVGAARASGVKVVAVCTSESSQMAVDVLSEHFGAGVLEFNVPPVTDEEFTQLVEAFPELRRLSANPRSRELLRRLVVVDLLIRAQVPGTPLTEADAMNEVWTALVRTPSQPDRGFPDARETAFLRLAELELGEGERLDVLGQIDAAALDGLRRDGLLRSSLDDPFSIGPEFAHDELRRYAIARLLLVGRDPAGRLRRAGAPRWTLAAARLACQTVLAQPDAPSMPLKGRLAAQQSAFDDLAREGHGSRWGDVPGEALLALADPEPLLRDAWPELVGNEAAGLRRLARLVDQRLRDENFVVDVTAVEPIIAMLLETPSPWKAGDHAEDLLRAWLRAHVVAGTPAEQPLRILLRKRLLDACAAGDQRLAEEREPVRATHTTVEDGRKRGLLERLGIRRRRVPETGNERRRQRERPQIPHEMKDEVVVEFLALLGPDLGDDGKLIFSRIARDAPAWLAPAVDAHLAGLALAAAPRGLLAELTEAYYLDDELVGIGSLEDGVRSHRWTSLGAPPAAWDRGPFIPLLRTDFHNGVAVFNRLLNHAARVRSATLADLDGARTSSSDTSGRYEVELAITGQPRCFVGDAHVWRWYRGSGVGPYPCISALLALERECDCLIENGIPIVSLVSVLLDGCENLAMVGLIVGLLVRHLEDAEGALDAYITEPLVWHMEFVRVGNEASPFAIRTDQLAATERRQWSLREAAMSMVLGADSERVAQLKALGEALVHNARRIENQAEGRGPAGPGLGVEMDERRLVAQARSWAGSLDQGTYQIRRTAEGFTLTTTPPADLEAAREADREQLEGVSEAIRLFVRYHVEPAKDGAEHIGRDELVADMVAARTLVENPPPRSPHDPLDVCALVAATALEAHFVAGESLPDDTLGAAAEIVLEIGEASPAPQGIEDMLYEYGADRSAARAIPLLLLPAAAPLRKLTDNNGGAITFDRAVRAGLNLSRTLSYEVRFHLARGLDRLWKAPCADGGRCHHDPGWQMVVETMRYCVLSRWEPGTEGRSALALEEPFSSSLAGATSVIVPRLDGAIRTLAPAAVAHICISAQARELLAALLEAQRRSLLAYERGNPDERGTHSLVSARALLTLAGDNDIDLLYEHIDACADNSAVLDNVLRALSAAAEETPDRAATAKHFWPDVVRRVIQLNEEGRTPFADRYYGDMALAALLPEAVGELPYLYREVADRSIMWWDPVAWTSEVEAWLPLAVGKGICVGQLVGFLGVLPPEQQLSVGLSWIERLVLTDPASAARSSGILAAWLVEMRPLAVDAELWKSWQIVVDALVVAGVTRLAPYSD